MENSRCKKGTRRNKKTNLCEPVNKQKSPQQEKVPSLNKQKSPLKRCQKGTRRNKTTNLCEPVNKQKSQQQEKVPSLNKKKSPLKRCQKGTKRNKKTNLCEPVNKISNHLSQKIPSKKDVVEEKEEQIMLHLEEKEKKSSKQTQSEDELKNRKRIDELKKIIFIENRRFEEVTDRLHLDIQKYNLALKENNNTLAESLLKFIQHNKIIILLSRSRVNTYRDELQQLELLLPINKINLDTPQELLIVINSHGITVVNDNNTPHILDIPPSLVERNNEGEIVGKVFYRLTTSTGYYNYSNDIHAKFLTQEIKREFMKNPVFLPFFSKCKVKESTFCLVGAEKKCFNEGKICIPRLSNSKYIEKEFTPSINNQGITFIFKNGDTYDLFDKSSVEKFIKKYFNNTSSYNFFSVFEKLTRYSLSEIFKILKELNDKEFISNVYIYDNSCGSFYKKKNLIQDNPEDKVEIKKINANLKLLDDGNLLYGGSFE
jgi:hypothetical protein